MCGLGKEIVLYKIFSLIKPSVNYVFSQIGTEIGEQKFAGKSHSSDDGKGID